MCRNPAPLCPLRSASFSKRSAPIRPFPVLNGNWSRGAVCRFGWGRLSIPWEHALSGPFWSTEQVNNRCTAAMVACSVPVCPARIGRFGVILRRFDRSPSTAEIAPTRQARSAPNSVNNTGPAPEGSGLAVSRLGFEQARSASFSIGLCITAQVSEGRNGFIRCAYTRFALHSTDCEPVLRHGGAAQNRCTAF